MPHRQRLMGRLRVPRPDEIEAAARREFLELSAGEAQDILPTIASYLAILDRIEAMPPVDVALKYQSRDPGREPTDAEDPYNAFARIVRVEGSGEGPLRGRTVAVKDSICVAGIPRTNASRTLRYVPTIDATVVERMLDAGATLIGTLNMDDHGCSGYGETSIFGPPQNPQMPSRTCGGSSGGAGSALASGAIDFALGTDAGGSARIPAAMCGVVAIKGTHGLVPQFGGGGLPSFIDAICPMARTVEDLATLLEVVSGPDWRETSPVAVPERTVPYSHAAEEGVRGLRIGVVKQCVDDDRCQPAVLEAIKRAGDTFANAGATVETVSIPEWNDAYPIWLGLWLRGLTARLRSDDLGYPRSGIVDVHNVHHAGIVRRQESGLLPPLAKVTTIATSYLEQNYYSTLFAQVYNQRWRLTQCINSALERVDLLMTPTCPTTAILLECEPIGEVESLEKSTSQVVFTAVPNVTQHPALAIPCGSDTENLPTSVQIIGRPFDEHTMLRAGFALQARGGLS